QEPFYVPGPKGAKPDFNALKTMAEVLRTQHAGVATKWYFSLKDTRLMGFNVSIDRDEDPCEVYLSDYRAVGGKMLPHKMEVRHGPGLLVPSDGYILTVAAPMLDTRELRVHLSDGRRYHAKIVVQEPELDIALVKIDTKEKLDLPFFDIAAEAKKPMADAGTG